MDISPPTANAGQIDGAKLERLARFITESVNARCGAAATGKRCSFRAGVRQVVSEILADVSKVSA